MSAITKQTQSLSTQETSTNPLTYQKDIVFSVIEFLSVDDLENARRICQLWHTEVSRSSFILHAVPVRYAVPIKLRHTLQLAGLALQLAGLALQIAGLEKNVHKITQLNEVCRITCVSLRAYMVPSKIFQDLLQSSRLRNLETLILRKCAYECGEHAAMLHSICQMKTLTSLTITNDGPSRFAPIQKMRDATFAQICELSNLRILNLRDDSSWCYLTDFCFSNLSKLPYLKELYLDVYADLTGEQIDVSPLPQLEVFSSISPFSDKGLWNLCNTCPNLTQLSFSKATSITDNGLKYLRKLPNLNTLTLYAYVTDKGLEPLSRLPNLKTLQLLWYTTKLTKRGVIEKLPKSIAVSLYDGEPIER